MSDNSTRGKTALITGAAKRLGKATALHLAEEGINLILHYRDSETEVQQLQKELQAFDVKTKIIQSDFGKQHGYNECMEQAFSQSDTIDFLINNASIFPQDSLEDANEEMVTENIRINAWAPFVLSRDFAKRVRSGAIINFLDTRITGSYENHMSYYVSKKMLATLTTLCARKFAPHVRVNAVAPGAVLPPEGKDEAYLEQITKNVPLQTSGNSRDITNAVVFLLKNDYITGQILFVDGGQHLTGMSNG